MTDAPATAHPRRWDPMVRLTHWAVVLAVIANGAVTAAGSASHVWIGYALAAILALRLLWGLIGPAEARFSAFPPSPRRALAHMRDIAAGRVGEHRSHNPLGALMAYAIWGLLLVVIASGVAMAGLPPGSGSERREAPTERTPSAGGEREEADQAGEGSEGAREEGPLAEVHEAAVNLLYALIVLHLAGVIFESRRQRRNLALAMLPGGR